MKFRELAWMELVFLCANFLLAVFGLWGLIDLRVSEVAMHFPIRPVQYNTVLAFVLYGLGGMAVVFRRYTFARIVAAIIIVIGALRLIEYIGHLDLRIEPLLLYYFSPLKITELGKMGPLSALNFILAGVSIAVLGHRSRSVSRLLLVALLNSAILAFCLMSLFGYLSGSRLVYDWLAFSGSEVPTFLCFTALSLITVAFVFFGGGAEQIVVRKWAPIPVWFGVFIATLALWQALSAQEYRQAQRNVRWSALAFKSQIETRLNERIVELRNIAKRWHAYRPTPEQWHQDASTVVSDFPDLTAVEWADETLHVRWITPLEGNEAALGLDLTFEKRRKEALEQAIERRQITITRSLELVVGGRGFLIYVPLFDHDQFDGVVLGVAKIKPLIDSILKQSDEAYSVSIYEGSEKIYEDDKHHNLVHDLASEHVISLYNMHWKVRVTPQLSALKAFDTPLPETALAAGLILSSLLALSVYLFQAARARANQTEISNEQLKREIKTRMRVTEELRASQARLAGILEMAQEAIISIDAKQEIILFNFGAQQIFGYSPDEVLGRPLDILIPEQYVEPHRKHVSDFAHSGEFHRNVGMRDLEITGKRKNGEEFPAEVSISKLNLHGEMIFTAMLRDISDRKEAERALQQSEERNRLILNTIKDYAIFMLDPEGFVVSWNIGVERVKGYRADEIIGRHFSIFWPKDAVNKGAPQRAIKVAAEQGRYEEEGWRVRKDGSLFRANEVITAIREDGELRGFSQISRDITERLELEERTLQSRDFYFKLFSDFPNLVWRSDTEGECDYFNQAWLDFRGRSLEQELGEGWMEGIHPDESDEVINTFRTAVSKQEPFEVEFRLRKANGEYGWIIDVGKPFYDIDGKFSGYVGSCYDITQRRAIEIALNESQARYQAMTSNVPGMVFQLLQPLDDVLRFTYVSKGAITLCGLSPDIIKSDFNAFLSLLAKDQEQFKKSICGSAIHLNTWNWEGQITLKNNGYKWVRIQATPSVLEDGSVLWDGIVFDITQSKAAQSELERSREQLRALTLYLQTVREEEKAHIARELHDELGGILTALKMDTVWLKGKTPVEQQAVLEKISGMGELVDTAIQATRRIVTELRPTVLDDLGLIAALHWQAEEFQKRLGIECTIEASSGDILDSKISIAFFRIYQEALTNVARHAKATKVESEFREYETEYMMRISDNGIGIQTAQVFNPTSHGLRGIVERAEQLKGKARIEGQPGKGTTLEIRVPKL